MKVGDIVSIKEEWATIGFYYGLGVVTMIEEGDSDGEHWESFRVQWNQDWFWHTKEQLELISEGW